MNEKNELFYLNRKYEHFVVGGTPIELKTVTGMSGVELIIVIALAGFFALGLMAGFFNTEERHALYRENGVETTLRVAACNTIVHSGKTTSYTAYITFSYYAGDTQVASNYELSGRCDRYPIDSTMPGVYLRYAHTSIEPMSLAQLNQPFYVRQSGFGVGMLIWLACAGTVLYFLLKTVLGARKSRRLHERGQILDGRLANAKSEYRGKNSAHFVVVEYDFTAPDGTRLSGKQENHRQDLRPIKASSGTGWFSRIFGGGEKEKRKTEDINRLPHAGTTVQVLYADENTYVML